MKWIPVVSAAGVLLWSSLAPAQESSANQNATSLVDLAIARNRDLLAVQERIREAQALLQQAGVRPAPTLEVEGTTGRPLGTKGEEEFSAGYSRPIETGGKREKRIRVAEKALALAKAEHQERVRALAHDLRTREIDSISEREKLAALDLTSQINQEAYRLTEARVQKGDAALLDQQLLSVENNRLDVQRLTMQGRSEVIALEVRRLAGITRDEPLPLAAAFTSDSGPLDLEHLKQLALDRRPDLQIVRVTQEQGGAEIALTEALSKADITVSARYAHRNSAFDELGFNPSGTLAPLHDRDNIVTVGVSIPLLNRRRNQGNIDAAISRERSARLRREFLEGAIPLEVEAAYRRWTTARAALALLNRGVVDQSQKNLAVIRQAYQLGQLRLLDVLNEQRRLLDTQLAQIDAKAELARAQADLEHAVGGDLR